MEMTMEWMNIYVIFLIVNMVAIAAIVSGADSICKTLRIQSDILSRMDFKLNQLEKIDGVHRILSKPNSSMEFISNNLFQLTELRQLRDLTHLEKLNKLNKLDMLDKLDRLDILVEQKEKELLVNFTYDSVKNRDSLNFDDNFYSPSNQKHRELIERMDNIERLLKEIATK